MPSIRRATEDDRRSIYEVHVAAIEAVGPPDYDPEQVKTWAALNDPEEYVLNDDRMPFLVAEYDDSVVGFAQADFDASHVEKVYVHPENAGQGVATALVERLELLAVEADVPELTVVASRNAVGFYARIGYERDIDTVKTLSTADDESIEFACVQMVKRLDD